MRLMRRVRDGKVAVYDQSSVDTGRWEEVVEKKPEPQKPKVDRPLKPLIRRTDEKRVMTLFQPPIIETQSEPA